MFKQGDRVEHKRRGKGTFIEYDWATPNDAVVEFDKDSDAEGDTLCVTAALLTKIDDQGESQ